jgi:hypothetical protein
MISSREKTCPGCVSRSLRRVQIFCLQVRRSGGAAPLARLDVDGLVDS